MYRSFSYRNENAPYVLDLKPGRYILEVWGARGARINQNTENGKGGYSKGVLDLYKDTKVYVFVGQEGQIGKGIRTRSSVAFNGGGYCTTFDSTESLCAGGGGATDVRIGEPSLKKRVIVAGGGGGSGHCYTYGYDTYGGAGGGLVGETAMSMTTGGPGQGATQEKAGTTSLPGSFGYGGNATGAASGGGGGLFGGGAGGSHGIGGGGGSGFVLTFKNYNASKEIGIDLELDYCLKRSELLGGNETFPPNPSGNGHGFARFTFLFECTFIIRNRFRMNLFIYIMIMK